MLGKSGDKQGPTLLDRAKSLVELEGDRWDRPVVSSGLTESIDALGRKPIGQMTAGDLRLMISQGYGLAFLVPLAVEMLESRPLKTGTYYPGDLLLAVLRCPEGFLSSRVDVMRAMCRVCETAMARMNKRFRKEDAELSREIAEACRGFLVRWEGR